MERHFLVTVSEDQSYLCGVRFVGNFFSPDSDLRFTLFYTAPRPAEVWGEERNFETLELFEVQKRHNRERGQRALEKAKDILCGFGFSRDRVETRVVLRTHSKFMDIIQEGARGMYDAMVLGRRALVWLEKAYSGSVSESLYQSDMPCPLWLCRSPELKGRDVLVCVDGTRSSERMVDHVGFVLAAEPGHKVALMWVDPPGGVQGAEPAVALLRARETLMVNGLSGDRIDTMLAEAVDPVRAVLGEAEKGRYAAVAVGRSDPVEGARPSLFYSSLSAGLFKRLERAALWISP
ncbi:MAG: universal stress protein [Desulfovibrionaceae bacterium]|nr:universal stress protein [Desulfovibrionaceae bacterium]